jgi:hypothetical protein
MFLFLIILFWILSKQIIIFSQSKEVQGMGKGARVFVGGLLTAALAGTLVFSGCTRYANEQQMSTLKEAQAASAASDQELAKKEKEKAELQAKLQAKQDELKKAQAEQEQIKSKLK